MSEKSISSPWSIYVATNSTNGKAYVGKTTRPLKDCVTDHFRHSSRGSSQAIHAAIREHGENAFSFKIVDTVSSDEVKSKQRWWIDKSASLSPSGYNMNYGGSDSRHKSKNRVTVPSWRRVDITGKTFDRLKVLALEGPHNGHLRWKCECQCGAIKSISGESLRRGKAKSCGCIPIERPSALLHGQSKNGGTRTFHIWSGLKARCLDPNSPAYKDYGGRGIKVCDRWLESFANFFEDVGECPPGLTLDRYPNNDGNYEPGNVRWATRKEQANNRRQRCDARLITLYGETKHLSAWMRDPRVLSLGISNGTISSRLSKGWPEERALTRPNALRNTDLTVAGVTRSLKEWAAITGISRDNLYQRIFVYKWPVDKALST